jgi:prevent-host-death family protein
MSYKLQECVKPISYIKTNAADMMKYVNENKNSLVITQNGEAKAVLMDVESYQTMKDAFNLIKMIQLSEKDVRDGKCKSSDQAFKDIREKYKLHESKK